MVDKEVVEIMDIPFINSTRQSFVKNALVPKLSQKEKCFIVTANPEIVMETRRNNAYKQILLSADFVVPDGAGIILAAKMRKSPLQERIAGFDLMTNMLELANEMGSNCYFLGGTKDVNDRTVQVVAEKYPNIHIVGHHHGFFDIDDEEVLEAVKKSEPDFVFVALGFPKQEEWIFRSIPRFAKGIFMGVGGSFDVLSGTVKRAPDRWIKLNLEWLYRLLKQPFRWKRILPIFGFMWLIFINRHGDKRGK